MTGDRFIWMPYIDLPRDCMPHSNAQRLWTARCTLLFISYAEWCYTDRVTRQFGYIQSIPRAPDEGHERLHQSATNESIDWVMIRESHIRLWNSRVRHILMAGMYEAGIGCTADYDDWYDTVTRRLIVRPDRWVREAGFQGTQGVSEYYVSISYCHIIFFLQSLSM